MIQSYSGEKKIDISLNKIKERMSSLTLLYPGVMTVPGYGSIYSRLANIIRHTHMHIIREEPSRSTYYYGLRTQ